MPSLKELLNAWAQRIGKPKNTGQIAITPPQPGDWFYFFIAPANGRVWFFANNCFSLCVTNTHTGELHYIYDEARGMHTFSQAVQCKKGDQVNLYYGATQVSSDLRCHFIPDEGSS